MRLYAIAAAAMLFAMAGAQATPLSPAEQEIDVCVKAAAATDHVNVRQVDRGACQCATAELHKVLKPGDYDLHERMLEIIASGADEKTFNAQMSDIMVKRGMNQSDVDAFLARTKAAQQKAQEDCDPSIMLDPQPSTGH
jgi:hypothetical protein